MTAFLLSLLSTILPKLADSLLKGINDAINNEMNRRNEIALGQAQQSSANAQAQIKDVKDAEDARTAVRVDAARDPGSVSKPDPFSRD